MKISIPKDVKFLIDKIYENGYEAYIVGGCVRDSILNLIPNDYDITTNATPNKIIDIFKDYKIIDNGIKHGTVAIIVNNDIYENARPATAPTIISKNENLLCSI